jgi:aspartyl protease family protein
MTIMTEEPPTNKTARVFTWLSWILFLILITYAFDDFLSQKWNPNQQVTSHTNDLGKSTVILKQNRMGHYVSNGEINGKNVTFLLDTGATQVSIPAYMSERLQLVKQGSYYVQTANGNVKVYKTTITELRIGDILLYNVAANINPGMQADEILLGMSALKRVEFSQSGQQLSLTLHP